MRNRWTALHVEVQEDALEGLAALASTAASVAVVQHDATLMQQPVQQDATVLQYDPVPRILRHRDLKRIVCRASRAIQSGLLPRQSAMERDPVFIQAEKYLESGRAR